MRKNTKIIVQNLEIGLLSIDSEDYICLTDMIKAKDGDFFVSDWLRNVNTLEYLHAWEGMHNSDFNYGEYALIRNQSLLCGDALHATGNKLTLRGFYRVKISEIWQA